MENNQNTTETVNQVPGDIPAPLEGTIRICLEHLQKDIHATALSKGWWDLPQPAQKLLELNPDFGPYIRKLCFNPGEKLALIHSEISEGLENLRAGSPPDDKIPEFTGIEAELADAVIRILDMSEYYKLDVIGAVISKAKFNKTRKHKHGGKAF